MVGVEFSTTAVLAGRDHSDDPAELEDRFADADVRRELHALATEPS